jgi:5-methyltetrahydrofolate--homocysteine methyltransferase
MNLLEAIEQRPLLSDGAMGTQLQAAGLDAGECGDAWCLDFPDRVLAIQRSYVEAGSDCITSNTFGACRLSLQRHGLADRVSDINQAAVQIAKTSFGGKEGFVLGDVGPFGGLMEPFGETRQDEVLSAYIEQIEALVRSDVDAVIVETQTSLEEMGMALMAARERGAPCIIASMAFDVTHDGSDVRTMMGVSPEQCAEFAQKEGAHVVAMNCGTGVDARWAVKILQRYRAVCDLPLMAQPNAGKPELVGSQVVYRETPEEMAEQLEPMLLAGAGIVGACCGTTPDHIRALRNALDRRLVDL